MPQRVTVRKSELIEIVQTNRDQHKAIFDEAVEGYRAKAVGLLEGHIQRIRTGKLERVYVMLPEPENHTRDYDRVLSMLKMDVNETVTVDEQSYQSYVLDDWAWKRQFLTSSSAYSETAARLLEDEDD